MGFNSGFKGLIQYKNPLEKLLNPGISDSRRENSKNLQEKINNFVVY